MSSLQEIEKNFWKIYTQILPDEDINPLNLEQEKSTFFQAADKGQSYNPQFIYRKTNNKKHLDKLEAIIKDSKQLGSYLGNQYVLHASRLSQWVSKFEGKGKQFGEWLYHIHARPSNELLEKAKNQLDNIGYLEYEKGKITSQDAKEFFYKTLGEYGFSNWEVKHEKMPAKVRISSAEKVIYIDKDSRFSDSELLRLSVHEIGTHVTRFENGSKQDHLIYRFGFHDYLECEEGLAIFSEEKAGRLSNYDIGKYCLRVIACDMAEDHSFWEIYSFLNKYIEKKQAFTITARVKRGIVDASEKFGYTKDQLYYSGYLKIKTLCVGEIQRLYVGKIGFDQLCKLDFNSLKTEHCSMPNWVN